MQLDPAWADVSGTFFPGTWNLVAEFTLENGVVSWGIYIVQRTP